MAVSVMSPQPKREREQQDHYVDPLDQIMKALNIASTAYGLATAGDRYKELAEDKSMKKKMYEADLVAKGLMEQDGKIVENPESMYAKIQMAGKASKEAEIARKEKDFGLKESMMDLKQKQFDLHEKLAKSESANRQFKNMAEDKKILVEKLAATKAQVTPIVDQFDQFLTQLNDPNLSDSRKLQIARQSMKLMNSPLNPDAVGAEEVKRLGSYLTAAPDPFGPKGLKVGVDIPGFIEAVKDSRDRLNNTLSNTSANIDRLMGREVLITDSNKNTSFKNNAPTLENPFLPSANAGAMKPPIRQNGVEYNWNQKTQRYE
jgi:hypothetical protein